MSDSVGAGFFRLRRPRIWRLISWLAGLAIVAFVARSVARNWGEVRSADLQWDFGLAPLLGGVLITWAVFIALCEAWRRLVAGWGYPMRWWSAARVWLLSSMAKYVPGKVWALAGMAWMAQQRGVAAWAATGSSLLLQVIALGAGAVVVSLAGMAWLPTAGIERSSLVALAIASVAITAVVVSPRMIPRLIRRFVPRASMVTPPPLGAVGFGVLANFVAWAGYGLAFRLFIAGALPEVRLSIPEAIGASTLATIIGGLVPFAPAGIGVRESVLVLVLRERTGLAQALALAAVARLGTTLAEVVACVPFLARSEQAPR